MAQQRHHHQEDMEMKKASLDIQKEMAARIGGMSAAAEMDIYMSRLDVMKQNKWPTSLWPRPLKEWMVKNGMDPESMYTDFHTV